MNLTTILLLAEAGRNTQFAADHPEIQPRIDNALHIIRQDHISDNGDGTYTVKSQTKIGEQYTVNGVCSCPDATGISPKTGKPLTTFAPKGRCKHRIAVDLVRKAAELARHQQQCLQRAEDQLAFARHQYEAARHALVQAMQRMAEADAAQQAACASCLGLSLSLADEPPLRNAEPAGSRSAP